MKKLMIFSLLACFCYCSCQRYMINKDRHTIQGNGIMISQDRPISSFHTIQLDAPVHVQIVQGNELSLVLKGDENLCQLVKTTVRGKKLIFYTDKSNFESKNIEAMITLPESLTGAEVSGMGYLTVLKKIDAEEFTIATSGMGKVVLTDISVKNLTVDLSGMGKIDATGTSTNVVIDNSGMGAIRFDELVAQNVRCDNSGMGHISLHVTKSLKANVSGMGKITYQGDPDHVTTDVSGMGSVKSSSGS